MAKFYMALRDRFDLVKAAKQATAEIRETQSGSGVEAGYVILRPAKGGTVGEVLRSLLLLGLAALLLLSGCKRSNARLYLAPIGDVPSARLGRLADHYRQKFGVEFEILPRVELSRNDYDALRHQFVAESLIWRMQQTYPNLARNPSAIVIGITEADIYPNGRDWAFCFGWRDTKAHMAVVSTARMDLHYEGEPTTGTDSQTRLQKVVTKDLGILYFGKSPSSNPRSVLYNQILGIQELDYVSEDF